MRLIRPAPDATLELIEVGPAVGNVANDGPQLHAPFARFGHSKIEQTHAADQSKGLFDEN
jgi:hypothetical protein